MNATISQNDFSSSRCGKCGNLKWLIGRWHSFIIKQIVKEENIKTHIRPTEKQKQYNKILYTSILQNICYKFSNCYLHLIDIVIICMHHNTWNFNSDYLNYFLFTIYLISQTFACNFNCDKCLYDDLQKCNM